MVDITDNKKKKLFVDGAYIVTLPEELTENEFIKRAGLKNLKKFEQYPFVSIVLDNPKKPVLVGHKHGRAIAAVMHGHKKWQTMEWVK